MCRILFILVLIILPSYFMAQENNIIQLLPQSPSGWIISSEPKIYTPETLYDYIDGGAELYISYNFREVASVILAKEGLGEIRVEVFDMGEPKNAFGVFSHTRTKNDFEFGQGSQYFTGAEIFWKGKYFISVIANDENEEITKTIQYLSGQIDLKIVSKGDIPAIIKLLPQEGLEPDGFLYFHHYIWINAYYFISTENILNITDSTDAVLAKYGDKNARSYMLIVQYKSDKEAYVALKNFMAEFFDNDMNKRFEQIEDDTWVGTEKIENTLVCLFNLTSKDVGIELIDNVETNISNQKNQQP
jgi:hypothetical protein